MKPNPFPGMNPWLEESWGDVHTRLTTYASDVLQPSLPAGLRARVEEYVTVEDDFDASDESRYSPDVRVLERPGSFESGGVATAVASTTEAFTEPLIVTREIEPETSRSVQIVDTRTGHRIVTSIEFLSPTNKNHGRQTYLRKQEQMLEGGVHLVEIDLLRGGPWVLSVPLQSVPKSHREPYRICVVNARQPTKAEVYPVSLRLPLPSIRIPLRPGDADVRLNLQTLVNMTYINGGYEDLDYTRDPIPPLSGPDAEWAVQLLKDAGLR